MTAEQLFSKYFDGCYWDDLIPEKMQKYAIEFAKMHVTEALKQASEKAQAYQMCKDNDPIIISKESILNAYPIELIK